MMVLERDISKRISFVGLTIALIAGPVFLVIPSLAQAQDRVPLPQGMPTLPQGVSPYGVTVRRREPEGRGQVRRGEKAQEKGERSPGRRQPERSPNNTFEIGGTLSLDTPRFAVIGERKPLFYTVRSGDTLWDISETYFQDPWYWPRLWAMNPSITNPHWIYPGDRIRLQRGRRPDKKPSPKKDPGKKGSDYFGVIKKEIYSPTGAVSLRQTSFIEEDKLKKAGVIKGALHEKIMMATYDVIYIEFKDDNVLEAGKRYTIYSPVKKVHHPHDKSRPGKKKVLGRLVRIHADVEIKSTKWKDKKKKKGMAKGVILRAVNPVERGFLVGDLKRRYKSVKPIKNTTVKDVEGVVMEVFDNRKLIGSRALVFLDKGSEDKVKKGHVFFAIRRGDAYRRTMELRREAKPGEKKWPVERVAALVVVDVAKNHCAAVVRETKHELQIGDKVRLQYDGPDKNDDDKDPE